MNNWSVLKETDKSLRLIFLPIADSLYEANIKNKKKKKNVLEIVAKFVFIKKAIKRKRKGDRNESSVRFRTNLGYF